MLKPLLPALLIAILPACLLSPEYVQQPETISLSKINQTPKAVYADSIPVGSKSSSQVNSMQAKSIQKTTDNISRPGTPLKKTADPKTFKGSVLDTVGIIYDLNAFYPLGH